MNFIFWWFYSLNLCGPQSLKECFQAIHSTPGRFIYRFPDLVRCEGLTLLSSDIFLLPSFYVRSFKYIKACVTGCRFSLRLMYALITAWVALTGRKNILLSSGGRCGGVCSLFLLSAARLLPWSGWCPWSGLPCVVLFWYAARRPSGLPCVGFWLLAASVFPLLDINIP